MMQFEIKNRFTGAVQFTAEIDCDEGKTTSIKIGLAVIWAIKARANLAGTNLAHAYLVGADLARADLADANLAGADLAHAYLVGADLARADLADANLARADLARANLAGADLARAYLAGANLARADLVGANLARAYLVGADLAHAYLVGANLAHVYLAGANLGKQWIIHGPVRSDGYQFFLTNFTGDGVRVKAGCRDLTLDNARKHWQKTRAGTPLGDETFAILDFLESMARLRGYDLEEAD